MRYVGIDPGTKCGWAILDAEGSRLHSGTWNLERRKGDGAGMLYVRFERLFREALENVGHHDLVVAYEQQFNRFAGSAAIGAGIMAHLQRICEECQVPYTGVMFSVVKKRAAGKGSASKDAVVAAAKTKWGYPLGNDDNEADALFIALCAAEGLV